MFCSLPKRRLRCTNLPHPTARIGFFIGSLAKRRLRCTDLPNPTVRIGFHAPLSVLRQATAAMHWSPESNRQDWLPPASLGPWPSDGSDAPISPNPTAKDWLLLLHACVFWSLPKWRLRCTNSSKTNRQDVRTCANGSAIYILHRLYWRRKTHFHPPSLNFVPCREITIYLFTG
jgi:hypothetical protein